MAADGSIIIDTTLDTKGFAKNSAKVERASASLLNKIEQIGARAKSITGFASFDRSVASAREKVAQLENQLKTLGEQTVKAPAYEALETGLAKDEKRYEQLARERRMQEATGVDEQSRAWQRLSVKIAEAEARLTSANAKMRAMEGAGTATIQGSATDQYSALSQQITTAKSRLSEYNSEQMRMRAGAGIVSKVKSAFASLGTGIKAAAGSIFKTNTAANSLTRGLLSLKSMFASRIKRLFISYVFNEMKEALKMLARFSGEFDKSISGMRNAAKQLSGNLASSFSGLASAVAPFITRLLGWLNEIMVKVSAFIAMLSGKSTVAVAKKQTDSYAKSLEKTGKAADKAKMGLAGFDEINNIISNKEDSGAGGEKSPADLFEQKKITDLLTPDMQAWIQKIKAAIARGDWRGVGAEVANGLNKAIEGFDAKAAAQKVSNAIKNTLDVIIGFIENFDWKQLGNKIAEFVGSIDWTGIINRLFEGMGAALGGLAALLWGLIEEAWKSVVRWWKETAFEDGKFTIEGLLKGIWEGMKGIWRWIVENIFKPFITGFKKAFGIASPSKQMQPLGGDIIQGMLKGIVDALKSIGKWVNDNIFQPVIDAIKTAFGFVGNVATKLYEIGASIVEGIKQGISNAWGSFSGWVSRKWESVTAGAEKVFDIHSPSAVFADIGHNIMRGLENGLDDSKKPALKTISDIADAMGNKLSGNILDFGTNGAEGVLSVLDRIAYKLGSIADVFDRMRIPQMAAGSIIPYAARAGAGERTESAGQGDIVIPLTLTLDGKPVYKEVVRINLQEIKRTGRNPLMGV